MALDLDPAHLPTLGGAAHDRHRRAGLGSRGALPRSGAAQHAERRARAPSSWSSSASSATRCSASTSWRCRPTSSRCSATPTTRKPRCRWSRSTSQTERWKEAEPLADMLVKKAQEPRARTSSTRCTSMLGKVHAALGNDEKALKAYQTAHQLDLTDQETIRGIADVALQAQGLAERAHQLPEGAHRARRGRRRGAHRRLLPARLHQARAGAGQAGDQQLREGARPRTAGTARRSKRWSTSTRRARTGSRSPPTSARSSTTSYDADERFKMLNEIGDIWADKDKNPHKAIEALRGGARAQAAGPRPAPQAAAALPGGQRVAEDGRHAAGDRRPRGRSPRTRRSYLYTMAQLYRDKLEDPDRAVELFNEALDLNPSYLEAFERINKILTAQKNWKQLERSYRKMLHRIAGKGNADLEYTLWHQLGLIYRDRLQQTRRRRSRPSRWRRALKPDDADRAPDPGRALRGDRAVGRRDRRAAPAARARSAATSTRTGRSTGSTSRSRPTTRPGAWRRRWRSCTRPTRRSSASSRTTARRACSR